MHACIYQCTIGLMHCASDMCGCVVSRNMFMGFAFLYFSRLKPYNPTHISIPNPLSPAMPHAWWAGWPSCRAW